MSIVNYHNKQSNALLYGYYEAGNFNGAVYIKQLLIHLFFPLFIFISDNRIRQGELHMCIYNTY
jgi:hypothetical protein